MAIDYKSIITTNSDYFHCSDFLTDLFRNLGFSLIKGLTFLADGMQSVFDSAFSSLNFTNAKVFTDFLSKFSVLITVVLTITFIALGLTLMFSEKKPPVLKNIMIGLAVIYIGPTMVSTLNTVVIAGKDYMITGSYASQTVLSNISDVTYIATNNFNFKLSVNDSLKKNANALSSIDAAEHVKPSQFSTTLQKDVFNHRLKIDDAGNIVWAEMGSKGLFDVFDPPYYYRYNINYFQIIVLQIVNILVFGFSAYAVIRMIYEIITTRIIAVICAMELTSGQKTIKVIEYFFNGYIVLFAIPTLLKVFLLWQEYVNTITTNGLVRCILIFFAALVVIDGPNVIEKLFGYDMGMSAGMNKIMAFMRFAQQARMQKHFRDQSKDKNKNKSKQNNTNSNNNSGKVTEPGKNSDSGNKENDEPNISNSSNSLNSSKSNNASQSVSSSSNVNSNGINQEPQSNTGNIGNDTSSISEPSSTSGQDNNSAINSTVSNGTQSEPGKDTNSVANPKVATGEPKVSKSSKTGTDKPNGNNAKGKSEKGNQPKSTKNNSMKSSSTSTQKSNKSENKEKQVTSKISGKRYSTSSLNAEEKEPRKEKH
jgi:hypothetical protein